MIGLLLSLCAFASTSADAIQADLQRWDTQIDQHANYQIEWRAGDFERLAKGEIVKRRTKLDGADRVIGAVWAPVSLQETWVSVQDELHWGLVDGLVEERLSGSTFQNKILYQRIKAPWPFKDRQWIIEIVNNLTLLEATEHKVIERHWDLTDRRGAKAEVEDGVWIPVNDGGWLAMEAGGGTLLVYHVRTNPGGNIPDEAATQWTMLTLGGMMKGLRDRSLEMKGHYLGDHPPVLWPDGTAIPLF